MLGRAFMLILFLSLGSLTMAQNDFFIGVKSGLNTTYINESKFGNKTYSKTGFIGGLALEYFINPRFGFAVDVLYKQIGFGTNINFDTSITINTDQTVISKFNYDYLSIPVIFRFNPIWKNKDKIHFYSINLGIAYSTLLKNEQITEVFDQNNNSLYTSRNSNVIVPEKSYLSGLIGFSARYRFKNPHWYIPLTWYYLYGIKNLSNDSYFPGRIVRFNEINLCLGVDYKF